MEHGHSPLVVEPLSPAVAAWLRARVPSLQGWCTPDKAVRLAEFVVQTRAAISVDLGVFGARSTIALATGHQIIGHGCVTGVDPWALAPVLEGENAQENDAWWATLDLEAIYRDAVDALRQAASVAHWRILRMTSREALGYFADRSIAVLHQDSNHSEQVSCEELKLWTPKMTPGGVWIMDDTDWATLQVAQYQLKRDYGYTLVEDHTQWRVFQAPA